MRTVHKFPLRLIDGAQKVQIPYDASFLHAAMQCGALMLWFEVETGNSDESRWFSVHGTGHSITSTNSQHLATVVDDVFVWHIYEE